VIFHWYSHTVDLQSHHKHKEQSNTTWISFIILVLPLVLKTIPMEVVRAKLKIFISLSTKRKLSSRSIHCLQLQSTRHSIKFEGI